MRVLHFQKAAGVSGSERHLLDLLRCLKDQGIDCKIGVLAAPGYAAFTEALASRSISHSIIQAGNNANARLLGRLSREIRAFQPDIVHTHLLHADLYGQVAAFFARVPGVSSIHSTFTGYSTPLGRLAAQLAERLAGRTIAISDHVQRFAAANKIVPPSKIRVVKYGIEVSDWTVSATDRDETRASLGLTPGEVALGIASRLVNNKGHDFLLEALSRALNQVPNLRLLIAGDGPLRPSLETLANKLLPPETFFFLGHLANLRHFLGACDIFAFPTVPGFGEGFGLATLEAMAAGKPVVATRIDSLPEVVEEGSTGYLVTPGDTVEFGRILVKLGTDSELRSRLGNFGRERARSVFSLESMVSETIAVYREVVKHKYDRR